MQHAKTAKFRQKWQTPTIKSDISDDLGWTVAIRRLRIAMSQRRRSSSRYRR